VELYPDFDVRERLLDALARVGKSVGWDAFVSNPILTPEPKWFPDEWSPDYRGVRRLSTRLLRYVGLDHQVKVAVEEPPEDHVAAWFSGLDDDTCWFGIDPRQLEREDSFVAALCHESCHALRRHHEIELSHRDREEEATDLTGVFVGFGVLLLNAADQYATSGHLVGTMVYTKIHKGRLGYLSPIAFAFLLAVQAIVRQSSKKEVRALAGHLTANQRAMFEKALDELEGQRAFLLDRLSMSDPSTWPAPRTEPVLVDLGIDEDAPLSVRADQEDVEEEEEGDRYVFRMVADASGRYRVVGLGLGTILGGIAGVKIGLDSNAAVIASALVPGMVGWFAGQSVGRKKCEDTCSWCDRALGALDERCERCRARIVAAVRSVEERLDLEDRIEQHGLEAGIRSFERR
jgi:hypothetical protein